MKKITVDESMCFGCGFCFSSSERFEMNEEGKSQVTNEDISNISDDELAELKDIAEGCPVEAIKIKED